MWDLKMENILLDGDHKNLKVIDFGLSNTFSRNELMKTHCGSLEYAAPELIATTDKYGPEVDIWSLGIILYCMVIGKLPFHTHYTDQYRRQKLLVQIQRGLTDIHYKDLALHAISMELVELLNKLIEPSVDLRLPLTECEVQPWVTHNGKIPFTPFVALPRDKLSKQQDIGYDTETEEVIDDLATLLETPRAQVEETVHENKCDDFSAMFNMLLDEKRKEKATPSILCPDIEVASDQEGSESKIPQSHNSTNFDLMALCSAPTWLGGDKRKSKRRKSPMPPRSPLPPTTAEEPAKTEHDPGATAAATGGPEAHALLSPTHAGSQVAELLRRNSSRRRTRRFAHSADPPSRSGSLRRSRRHHRPGTPSSGPHSPHSPSNIVNPEIKIDTPKQSPVPTIKRPANLKGLKECYSNDTQTKTHTRGLTRKSTLGPTTSYSRRCRRNRIGSDNTDGGDSNHSDSSNPCSTTNFHDYYSDGSQEMLSQQESNLGSKISVGSIDTHTSAEPSVESRIAHTDIRSIVRPKQIVLRSKVNGQVSNKSKKDTISLQSSSLQVPNSEDGPCRSASASPEIIIESMQQNAFANLSDDEKLERQMSCEIPKTDSEKRVEREKSDLLHVNLSNSDAMHNSMEFLGAASLKPEINSDLNGAGICDALPDTNVRFYANDLEFTSSVNRNYARESVDSYEFIREPNNIVADLYSKREKISLDDRILMQDDVSFIDSSDHNSSHENLLANVTKSKRRNKESLTSDDMESVSAPILLSPRELGLTFSPSESPGDSLIGHRMGSVMSSRHGSTPSVRFVMPSTPIRQMFHTPIARIESFHSDDFENYTSDLDALVTSPTSPSPSSNSTQTPTVPCFQYKLHPRRKKNLLKTAKHQHKLSNDRVQFPKDGVISYIPEKNGRDEGRGHDSSSECGSEVQVPDGDRTSNACKAKIFPMENNEEQMEGKPCKSQVNDKSKLISDVTVNQNSSKKHQNSTCRSYPWKQQSQDTEPNKPSIWRRGFVHLLKKKKLSSFGTSGNNNNDADSPSRYRMGNHSTSNSTPNTITTINNTRNGHARGTLRAIPPSSLDIPATNVEIKWTPSTRVVQNNIKASVDSGRCNLHNIDMSAIIYV
ncbi:Serine/threonine-protein kinase [Mactra antiquata]